MRRLYVLGLLVGNLFWSAHPLMGKTLLKSYTPAEAAWLRYGAAWLALMVGIAFAALVSGLRGYKRKLARDTPREPARANRVDISVLVIVGVLNFCLAPWLQLSGLSASQASDNSLIVAMEPLITVALAWIVLGQRPSFRDRAALAMALLGFLVLSGPSALSGGLRFFGNFALLVSLSGESVFSVGSARLVARGNSPLFIFGSSLTLGFVLLSLFLAFGAGVEFSSLAARLGMEQILAMLWLGPVGTTASYLFWIYALKELSVASVVLTLFVQPVFGSFLAALFLGEAMGLESFIGGAIILAAVALSAFQRSPRHY